MTCLFLYLQSGTKFDLSTPCYYNFISYTVLKLTYLPPPPPPRKETEQSKTKQTKNNVELLAKYREHWMVEGGGLLINKECGKNMSGILHR